MSEVQKLQEHLTLHTFSDDISRRVKHIIKKSKLKQKKRLLVKINTKDNF